MNSASKGGNLRADPTMIDIVPEQVFVCELVGNATPDPLYPEEDNVIRNAVFKRRREFALSRTCARRALAHLGIAPVPILPDSDRAPQWPSGVVGSITHCESYTAAAVCRDKDLRSLGIDAEINQPLPSGTLALIASPDEQLALQRLPVSAVCWDRLLFSAKESIFKAWFPLTRQWLDFLEADVTIDPVCNTFSARIPVNPAGIKEPLEGRFLLRERLLFTAVAIGST